MKKIEITGKETKAHIQEALKAAFPNVKFSFTSGSDSVLVSWTDGPITASVEEVINRFESYTRSPDRDDHYEPQPSKVVPFFQKDMDLPYRTPEQLKQVAFLLWKIIELGDQLEHPVPLEQLERVMEEMEQIRMELQRLNESFRIVNSDLQRLSEKLDKLIHRQRAGPDAPFIGL